MIRRFEGIRNYFSRNEKRISIQTLFSVKKRNNSDSRTVEKQKSDWITALQGYSKMDLAIQCAALDIDKKVTKKKSKKKKNVESQEEIKEQLEAAKCSPIIKPPPLSTSLVEGRRIGVSEQNQLDRELVKESLKNYIKVEKMSTMGSILEWKCCVAKMCQKPCPSDCLV